MRQGCGLGAAVARDPSTGRQRRVTICAKTSGAYPFGIACGSQEAVQSRQLAAQVRRLRRLHLRQVSEGPLPRREGWRYNVGGLDVRSSTDECADLRTAKGETIMKAIVCCLVGGLSLLYAAAAGAQN